MKMKNFLKSSMSKEIYLLVFSIFLYHQTFISTNTFAQTGWIQQTLSVNEFTAVYFPSNNDTGFIVSSYESVFKTTNKGVTWININTGSTYMGYSCFRNSRFGAFWGIMPRMTTDGGINWNEMSISIYQIGMGYTTGITFVNSTTGFVIGGDAYPMPMPCCYDGVINKTTNAGLNWFEIYRNAGEQQQEIKFKDEFNLTVLENSTFIKTTDGGLSWNTSYNQIGDIYFRARSMTDPYLDTMYVAGFKHSDTAAVRKSTDRGNSWFYTLKLPFRKSFRKIFAIDGNTVFAVGDTGLIARTTNGGINWTVQNSGTRKKLNGVWFINKDTGFVVGDSGLVLKTFTGGVMTNIQNANNEIPPRFKLFQNYPNPFNPNTKISFELRSAEGGKSYVSLKVYDVLGNEIAVLVNEQKQAGYYEVEFSGESIAGGLASGIYFYRLAVSLSNPLESREFTDVKKMMLVK